MKRIETRKLLYICLIFIGIMTFTIISKSYAIYKLEEKYDVIKQKIDGYTSGDIQIAAIVDGKETNIFPSYETNYKVLSVDCTNGVTGSFDVENWRIAIDDMSSTSTKCTVSFDSTNTNEIEPINMSKSELIALNDEYHSMTYSSLKTQLINDVYPIGSIYISTEDNTVERVENRFGGTWIKYGEDMTLVGASNTRTVNSTGGSSTVTIGIENLPNHEHSTSSQTISGGAHTHSLNGLGYSGESGSSTLYGVSWGYFSARTLNISTSGSHSHTIPSLKTTSCTNCNGTSLSVQNPYITVYMYKRTA